MSDFNPNEHLTKLTGKDYLEVKWRLVWLRSEHPDAVIETDMIEHSDTHAIFKATVYIPGPAGSATGWGSETKGDFKDFLEKAETKAIGRALGALGYGTQFAPDHEFGADQGRVVDSPVKREASPRNVGSTQTSVPKFTAQDPPPEQPISQGQINVIQKHQKDLGWTVEDMRLIVAAHNLSTIREFTAIQGRQLITIMADPSQADPYIALLRKPSPNTQAQLTPITDIAERARQ
jgi:hypothetical protein